MKTIATKDIPEVDRAWFMAKVAPVPECGCWLWEGECNRGYGIVYIKERKYRAHRVSYRLHKGPIPPGLTLDHLCRVRCCVNPDHLEAVDCKENVLRGAGVTAQNSRKTHCSRGHELTPETTRLGSRKRGRDCRLCLRLRFADYKRRRKERERSNQAREAQ